MSLTNTTAAALVLEAVLDGGALTVPCPNGDTLTVSATKVTRWGNSQWALPCGLELIFVGNPGFAAVEQAGRGACARAARKAMGLAAGR